MTPQEIPGDKIMRAVNFFNTFVTYHQEHQNDGRLPPNLGDRVTAGGWFVDERSDEVCRITERKVGRETYYDVQVNSKYADQDVDAIGVAIGYELNRYLARKQNGGQYTEQDKLRGAIFAGEYVAYMCDTYEEADELMRTVASRYGFPSRLTWQNVHRAIDSDDHGYATPGQVNALKRLIGPVDPRNG